MVVAAFSAVAAESQKREYPLLRQGQVDPEMGPTQVNIAGGDGVIIDDNIPTDDEANRTNQLYLHGGIMFVGLAVFTLLYIWFGLVN